MRRRMLLALGLWFVASVASAADLTKIERKLVKEPAYQSKAPKYCLLVFGAETRTRIWLVLDDDFIHVDRNGDGDLTGAGERLPASKENTLVKAFDTFEIGDVVETGTQVKHSELRVIRFGRKAGNATVSVRVAERGAQSAGLDVLGALEFADRPGDAPIIHFNGPLQLSLTSKQPLARGKSSRLNGCIGTPGLGEGTFATLAHDDLPEDIHLTADLEFAAAGAQPIKETVKLEERC